MPDMRYTDVTSVLLRGALSRARDRGRRKKISRKNRLTPLLSHAFRYQQRQKLMREGVRFCFHEPVEAAQRANLRRKRRFQCVAILA